MQEPADAPAIVSRQDDDCPGGVERARADLADIARDLRTPLTLLLAPLLDLLDTPAPALVPGTLGALAEARDRALTLLHLLETMAAPSAGGSPIDLATFTATLARSFQRHCDAAGVPLTVDCRPVPAAVAVDADAWEKIVVGLIAQAFTAASGGTIAVRLWSDQDHVQLTVSDTGAGIPADQLRYVFDRIQYSAASRGGPGLGLALVRKLVQDGQGTIAVQSTPGSGTTFTVRFPLQPSAASAAAVAGADPNAPGSHLPGAAAAACVRGHVVIAEDHAETRDYLGLVLQRAGFTVEAFADGDRALEACLGRAPDVLLSDVLMPGLGGYTMIERLRADERTAVIPVLLLSGRGGEDARIEGIAAGADDYLVKPVSGRELVARVDGAVRLGRLRRETARREQADLDALFSLAPDGVVVVAATGAILAANAQAGALFGCDRDELLTLTVEALLPLPLAAAHVRHRHAYNRAPAIRHMNLHQGLRCVRRDGREFIAEIALGPLQFRNQPCTMAVVRDVTERTALERERVEHEQRFRELSARLVEVQEAERRQLSTELHDRTSPQLAAIQINLRMLGNLLRDHETEDVAALLDDTVQLVGATTLDVREISANLRPAVLDDGGLRPALAAYARQFAQRTGLQVAVEIDETAVPRTKAVESSLFRIVQEALTNCVKHAKASHVTIGLCTDAADRLALTIADDGVGFDAAAQVTTGLGLLTMRERAEFLGGRLVVDAAPGQGTRIQVSV
jgi:PAS domain S-box-containing protein